MYSGGSHGYWVHQHTGVPRDTGLSQYTGHPNKLWCPGKLVTPIYWGTPKYWSTAVCWGTPAYSGIYPSTPRYPNVLGATPVGYPCILGVALHTGIHQQTRGTHPIYEIPEDAQVSLHSEVTQHTRAPHHIWMTQYTNAILYTWLQILIAILIGPCILVAPR